MRCLVTGGAGFIGSHLVDALLARGDEVVVIDDFSTGRRENLSHLAGNQRLAVIAGSIVDDRCSLEAHVAASDVVFHLAAVVGVPHVLKDPIEAARVNLWGTERVLEAAFRHSRRVVVASSSEVYGRSTAVPLSEDGGRVLGPTTVPRWSYATAKAMSEHLAFAYHARGLPVTLLRYFNCYGPRLHENGYGSVVAKFVSQALRREALTVHGDGRQTRSFTFVSDTVKATVLASEREQAVGHALNVGRAEEISVGDLAHLVLDVTGSESDIEFVPYGEVFGEDHEDARRRLPDPQRARGVLGFEARVALEEGLCETIEWCRKEGWVNERPRHRQLA